MKITVEEAREFFKKETGVNVSKPSIYNNTVAETYELMQSFAQEQVNKAIEELEKKDYNKEFVRETKKLIIDLVDYRDKAKENVNNEDAPNKWISLGKRDAYGFCVKKLENNLNWLGL
jgi:hypothetical protein